MAATPLKNYNPSEFAKDIVLQVIVDANCKRTGEVSRLGDGFLAVRYCNIFGKRDRDTFGTYADAVLFAGGGVIDPPTAPKKSIEQMAYDLAVDMKATGDDDQGNFWNEDDHGHLTDVEWHQVCDLAEALVPTVHVSAERRAEWAKAEREVAAEQAAERRALGIDR